ncbi:RRQRL motif-containing zinc-binding protein [Streptomyces sp. NBC_01800]|uniref:RRQRL motif-containing zinc-binding protein n=1 Tax=Streptomyces sp. NBC_01800 TaxID=2975945 RepID=UPI003FA38F99
MGALPVYRWRLAPDGYATRRQLRALGLRPSGQDVAAELRRPRVRGARLGPVTRVTTEALALIQGRRFCVLSVTTVRPGRAVGASRRCTAPVREGPSVPRNLVTAASANGRVRLPHLPKK